MKRTALHVMEAPGWSTLAILALMLAGSPAATAADRYVSATGTYDGEAAYTNLQEAIDAAAAGDTVWVEDGFICASGATTNANGASRIYVGKRLSRPRPGARRCC